MQKLTRLAALLLSAVMLVGTFAGCGAKDDNGPYAYAYITASSPATLDPGVPQYDSNAVKYLGLLYEGLFTLDGNGKLKKALCKDYYTKEVDGETKLYIELKDTSWSDGVSVTASNFVYSWKRLLEPGYEAPGASGLFCLKNAVAVKEGVQKMMTIDDIGLVELNEKLLEITFEDPDYNIDLFLMSLASPYLAPVREELVTANPTGWATMNIEDPTTIATNGPYCIGAWNSKGMTLKRNNYYYLKGIANENKQKYVNPEKIFITFTDAESAEKTFNATKKNKAENEFLFYLGEFSGDTKYKKKTKDMLATTAIFLNTSESIFKKTEARQGLAGALDRGAIAKAAGGKKATGIVPYGVFETKKASKQFRKVGGDLMKYYDEPSGISKGSVTLTIMKNNETHKTVAEMVQEMWKGEGVTVNIRELDYDKYCMVASNGSYEALLLDIEAYSPDAFSVLAQFSTKFSGRALTQNENYEYGFISHSTGYTYKDYDALIEKAFKQNNLKKRAALLHDAEEMLVDSMVCIPLYFNADSYTTTEISGLKTCWYGFKNFNKVKVKNYQKYIKAEEAKMEAELDKTTKNSKAEQE